MLLLVLTVLLPVLELFQSSIKEVVVSLVLVSITYSSPEEHNVSRWRPLKTWSHVVKSISMLFSY